MEQSIQAKTVLMAAAKIQELGILQQGKFVYQQVLLDISYDGYTLSLSNHLVRITLFFHNKVKADYKRLADLEDFYTTLKKIADYHG